MYMRIKPQTDTLRAVTSFVTFYHLLCWEGSLGPEGSQAAGDDPGIQVVDDTDSKETEHRHTERWQPDTHRSHGYTESLFGFFSRKMITQIQNKST